MFKVDPFWSNSLPNNWLFGQVAGVATDSRDHVWILHRANSIDEDEVFTEPLETFFIIPVPQLIEFDQEGDVVQAWGGEVEGFEWPEIEHGLFIDDEENVWVNRGGVGNHQIFKFTRNGTFLFSIGRPSETGGNNDPSLLGFPTEFVVDPIDQEVFISDGYDNNRVIVFYSEISEYKRLWDAYGNSPDDFYQEERLDLNQFNTPHAIAVSKDGYVYVADRGNNRIQVFKKDGSYISEVFIAEGTKGNGSTWTADFSPKPDQSYLYICDGTNQCVWILDRQNLKEIGHFGRMGRYAGQFI